MRRATSDDQLRAVLPDDPHLVHLLAYRIASSPAYATDGAVLFSYDYWGDAGCMLLGSAVGCARLLTDAGDDLADVVHVSLPEDAPPLLPARLFEPDVTWRFRWTDRKPAPPSVPANWLDESEWPEVAELLDGSFPDASARPGGRHARRWAGIRDRDGRLVACAADCTGSAVGFMASVASRVLARGTGVGLAVTCWLTHALLAEHGRVGLWQYSDNLAATAIYDRLGYYNQHRYVAGKLLH